MSDVIEYVKQRIKAKGALNIASAISRSYLGGVGVGVLSDLALRSYNRGKAPEIQIIQIQTLSGCNYSCSFCPIGKTDLPSGRMSLELYEHILGQLGDFAGVIHPYLMNEPLLDKRIVQLCKLARERTRAKLMIQTNGSRLTEELARALVQYATVVVNDYLEDSSVLERIRSYNIQSKNLILVDRDPHATLSNRAGNVPGRPVVHLDRFCIRPFTQVYITYDGRLVLCCQDWKFEEEMGDLKQNTLEEIWNNEKYRQLRANLLARNRSGLCSKCDFPGI